MDSFGIAIISSIGSIASGVVVSIIGFRYSRSVQANDEQTKKINEKLETLDHNFTDFRITIAGLTSAFVTQRDFATHETKMLAKLKQIEDESKAASTRVHQRLDEFIPKAAQQSSLEKVRDRQHAHANMILRIWDRQNRCNHCNAGNPVTEPLPPGF